MVEVNAIPELRFPEFDENWEMEKLGNNFDMKSGNFVPAKEIENEPSAHLFPCYGGNGLRGYTKSDTHEGKYNLIGRQGALCGNVNLVEGKFHATEHAVVVDNNDNYNIDFLFYILYNLKLNRLATGQAQPGLSISILNSVKFFSTTLAEQQKIASFLTAIDERIQLLVKKKAKLVEYKKGVMQKLFSQETEERGSRTPNSKNKKREQIRFKDENGNDYPDWEEKQLGEICKITTGKLDANAMVSNGKYRFYTCAKDYFKIDDYAFDFEALLISGNGANVGYIHHFKGKFNAYQRTYVLHSLSENYEYIKFFLNQNLQSRIHREKKDGNTPYIVITTLSELKIKIPLKTEQNKIADFLSSIEKSIDIIETEIEGTTTFKKGLLQKMFV